ncbi:hypothetical protein V8D89_014120 [Ganoderma adspersum]
MPKSVMKRLTKITRDFVWSDRVNTLVAMDYLYQPRGQGGLGLLDIEARNDAITVTWLKDCLNFSPNRALWTYFADDLYASNTPKNCTPKQHGLRMNPFLQSWKPKQRGLPEELKDMVKVTNKYGLRLEGLVFSRPIMREMPMWDHAMADTPALRWFAAYPRHVVSCLRDNHSLRTVRDFVDFVNAANSIREDAECENPAECMKKASEILAMLPPRWDPRGVHPEDYENPQAGLEPAPEGAVWFNRRITTKGHLGNVFQIFTGPELVCTERLDMRTLVTDPLLTVATDGSFIRNREMDAVAGAYAVQFTFQTLSDTFRPISDLSDRPRSATYQNHLDIVSDGLSSIPMYAQPPASLATVSSGGSHCDKPVMFRPWGSTTFLAWWLSIRPENRVEGEQGIWENRSTQTGGPDWGDTAEGGPLIYLERDAEPVS